jgi:hypothetical protein
MNCPYCGASADRDGADPCPYYRCADDHVFHVSDAAAMRAEA